jgi:Papain family cysteine protease
MDIRVIVDLRDQFGDIRDQGQRPTCMAFAASDAHSFARGNTEPLSVEYAYFRAVQRRLNSDRTTGVSFEAISEALSLDGQPLETDWPYILNLGVNDPWMPPKNLGTLFYGNVTKVTGGIADIYTSLDVGRPVIVVMQISISFFTISDATPLPGLTSEPPVNTHAVIVVGYGEAASGRCLLIRNSWDAGWGDGGYAWIHEDYLTPRLLVAGTLR